MADQHQRQQRKNFSRRSELRLSDPTIAREPARTQMEANLLLFSRISESKPSGNSYLQGRNANAKTKSSSALPTATPITRSMGWTSQLSIILFGLSLRAHRISPNESSLKQRSLPHTTTSRRSTSYQSGPNLPNEVGLVRSTPNRRAKG